MLDFGTTRPSDKCEDRLPSILDTADGHWVTMATEGEESHSERLIQRVQCVPTQGDPQFSGEVLQQLGAIAGLLRERMEGSSEARATARRRVIAEFNGPSGSGKTAAAKVVAHELGLALYRIDLSKIVSKYIGETEKNLRMAFDAADVDDAVLQFDEADALFGRRTEVADDHDRYLNLEVSYLLDTLESFRGLLLLLTTRPLDVPRRLREQLDFTVHFRPRCR